MEEKCTAIVLAAGQGKRMGSKIQKQFLEIQGKPVLYYSLACFEASPLIEDIVLVTGEDCIRYCQSELVEKYHQNGLVRPEKYLFKLKTDMQ